jgi:gliding motility associated protien GldN
MKRICFLLVLAGALFVSGIAQAQENNRRTPQMRRGEERNKQAKENGLPELTVRAQNMNQQLTQEIGNARWMRVIYRELDMTKDKNAPLYYPERPVNGMMSLFTSIFQLVSEGKLPIYEYLDGYEIFDDAHLVDFKQVLDRFYIMYDTIPGQRGEPTRFVFNESDIPSAEVKAFYVKEAWYFDQNNSVYDVKILAVCPIIFLNVDFGEQRSPMFWVPYEELRPYVSNSLIMTSNLNNAKTFTVDDYFRRRMFDGDIIKTENLMNLPLQAYVPADSLQFERDRIEGELVAFEKSLWFQPDSATLLSASDKKAAKKASVKKDKDKVSASKTKESKPKTSSPKPEKSAPERSIRRR